ncbi:MAG: hypothetical protein H8D23_16155 [Candidatus Brocadiales bacterium]|nr:hypothetical protein [Candidatus Brocadiales bacterium]
MVNASFSNTLHFYESVLKRELAATCAVLPKHCKLIVVWKGVVSQNKYDRAGVSGNMVKVRQGRLLDE